MESNKIYDATYLSTIGFDLKQKIVKLENGVKIKLIIHDTAGQNKKSFIFSQIDIYLIFYIK